MENLTPCLFCRKNTENIDQLQRDFKYLEWEHDQTKELIKILFEDVNRLRRILYKENHKSIDE